MGFPGTSIDDLELVSEGNSEETANGTADSDDEEKQSNGNAANTISLCCTDAEVC